MKVVFSRKGFDSSNGGFASPIFPDGTLFLVPIPDKKTSVSYGDLNFHYQGEPIQKILNDLTNQTINSGKIRSYDYFSNKFKCHLDPMVIENKNFKGIVFGQEGSSASHLIKKNIQRGDIFLFFSWSKEVEKINGKWQYKKNSPDIHLIWSFMEVDKVIQLEDGKNLDSLLKTYSFLEKHPHIETERKSPNVIFLSKKYKKFKLKKGLILTDIDNYRGRSFWKLPKFFYQPHAFSYLKKNKFTICNNSVLIESPKIGQEFVLDLELVNKENRKRILDYLSILIQD